MPIKIPNNLPAAKVLSGENIFLMHEFRAVHQDIRPLKIAIINLMPTKNETEIQLLRLLSGTALQVEVDFIQMTSHVSKNTPRDHLTTFYKGFDVIENLCYDGMIITGAPVETLPFEEVDYWPELSAIMEWCNDHVYSVLHICWGAQAGLYHHYGIDKYMLDTKLTGVFPHRSLVSHHPLLRGFDDVYYAPHSRYTTVRAEDIAAQHEINLLSFSDEAGVYIAASNDSRKIFVTGHAEYDSTTLASEYNRDIRAGVPTPIPVRYFPDDNPENKPVMIWRSHANLLFANWINFVIYQNTPYDLSSLNKTALTLQGMRCAGC
ncbi:MAG: homoserine O-succinyltransferase [Synergistaceae bacterium]|jgi:homoserine O-succinyltransferase|nr:homoserine O-succinyltransferase [Synergistaceae bacterium]